MSHTMVTYTVKPGREQKNAALVRAVFAELAQTRPTGFRYAVFQQSQPRQFVHLYTNEGAPGGALQQLPAFQAFIAALQDLHERPATFTEPELIGDYRTFADTDRPASAGRVRPRVPTSTLQVSCRSIRPRPRSGWSDDADSPVLIDDNATFGGDGPNDR